jgi:hypothetical protein
VFLVKVQVNTASDQNHCCCRSENDGLAFDKTAQLVDGIDIDKLEGLGDTATPNSRSSKHSMHHPNPCQAFSDHTSNSKHQFSFHQL